MRDRSTTNSRAMGEVFLMARFRSLLRETWWLWLLFLVGGTIGSMVSWVLVVTFPICIFTFFWFAYVRYDDQGNFKGS